LLSPPEALKAAYPIQFCVAFKASFSFLFSLLDTGFIVVGERIHHDMIVTSWRRQCQKWWFPPCSGDSMLPNDACRRPCSAFLVASVATQWEEDISIKINCQAQVVSS
jgi:hypothetical protein